MDLLHRIEDATIVDFTDPRTSEKLEHVNVKINNNVLKETNIENEELIDQQTLSLKENPFLDSINDAESSLKIPDNPVPTNFVSIQYVNSTEIPI
ncbi:11809_t:CDS:2 [Dentiscutata heterogama]|uniref:11809_t:CDS:1 n=1 Tax=Dentiscutata heterogama TaxID=1316150 RepID=A0ACA9LEQ2_9GLOM|nr:11809_t:CDS:2 [Dentiscutata heterogama]